MPQLTATPLSEIAEKPVQWLWKSRLPRGKLTLLDGDPGVGKSLLTLDIAARLSRGGDLPDGTPSGRPHTILLLAAEDDAAGTIRPRAAAAGADLERLIIVSDWEGLPLQLPDDLMELGGFVRRHRPDLIIIDPVMAFLAPRVGAQNDQCVRQFLNVLAGSADRTDCSILLVRHLRKAGSQKAVHRGSGSIGFIAAARTGLFAAPHPREPDRNVLAVSKSNLVDAPPALAWRIRSNAAGLPVVEWLGECDVDADELNAGRDVLRPRDRAVAWLRMRLASGPVHATDVLEEAARAGIPERTLHRAKSDLGVQSQFERRGQREDGAWWWFDPEAPCHKDGLFSLALES